MLYKKGDYYFALPKGRNPKVKSDWVVIFCSGNDSFVIAGNPRQFTSEDFQSIGKKDVISVLEENRFYKDFIKNTMSGLFSGWNLSSPRIINILEWLTKLKNDIYGNEDLSQQERSQYTNKIYHYVDILEKEKQDNETYNDNI